MTNSRIKILNEARNSLDKSGLDGNDRREILNLLDILLAAIEKVDVAHEQGELSASLASSLVSNQALLSLLKQQTAELDVLHKLSLSLTSSLDMPRVLDALSRQALQLVDKAWGVHIFLYNAETLKFGVALQADGSRRAISMPRQDGITYRVARQGKIIIVEDMKNDPLYANSPKDWHGSIIGIPLRVNQTVVGVMNLSRFNTGGFSDAEVRLLGLLADQAAVAISNANLHQQVQDQAYSDMLTGLPNRRALDERLEKELVTARKTGEPFAVVMMDLDGFKAINDTYGHGVGDEVLRLFFRHISQDIRASDFLARYGGDELCLIMGQTHLESALAVAGKITENMQRFTFEAPDGKQIQLALSGGVAIYPSHAQAASDLLRAADEALYRAKRHERGKFLAAKSLAGPLPSIRFSRDSKNS